MSSLLIVLSCLTVVCFKLWQARKKQTLSHSVCSWPITNDEERCFPDEIDKFCTLKCTHLHRNETIQRTAHLFFSCTAKKKKKTEIHSSIATAKKKRDKPQAEEEKNGNSIIIHRHLKNHDSISSFRKEKKIYALARLLLL